MGTIWVKQFTGGLDTRRMPETSEGGVLLMARDGHINRGGEFEKRAAFVPTFTLPAGTIGLASTPAQIVVFGSGAAPSGLPLGVVYQRLQHADGATPLTAVLSYDLYAGELYVVGEFQDGARFHFYKGVRVAAWFDGRARAAFTVAGSATSAQAARAKFQITGGTAGAGNTFNTLTVNGVAIKSGTAIAHTGNNNTTASAIAAAVNAFTSTPNYSATVIGNEITVTSVVLGAGPNGFAVAATTSGNVTVYGDTIMSGGVNGATATLNAIAVNGVSIMSAPVSWAGTDVATAAAIASAINTGTSTPEYTATVNGVVVNIVSAIAAAADNGKVVAFDIAGPLSLSPSSGLTLSGGIDLGTSYTPGAFVKTIGSKVYSTSGPNTHFSGLKEPTLWTTDTTGAGFIDMSTQASGSEELFALAKYNKYVAVFAGKVTQIWYMDPDPDLNQQVQVLNNTGTFCPRSVTQFGDNDLFYLDESGVRSLRARDASNAASTTDVGVPIDTLLIEKLKSIEQVDKQNVFGLIEPEEGRFWLTLLDTIYVFSFFSGAEINAWSTYEPGFNVEAAAVHKQRVYLRSADTIYVYGGLDADLVYDDTVAEAWLPYLDANAPEKEKSFEALDCACQGEWDIAFAMEPTRLDVSELVATVSATTFNASRIPTQGRATHVSPRFRSRGEGPAKLASVLVHYTASAKSDNE